jgi:hypothetical protein
MPLRRGLRAAYQKAQYAVFGEPELVVLED